MRKYLLVIFYCCLFASTVRAASGKGHHIVTAVAGKIPVVGIPYKASLEKMLGRKFSIREKIALKIFQWKLKKESRKAAPAMPESSKAKTAFILGLIGLIILVVPLLAIASIPLAILAIVLGNQAKKLDPHSRKARTAVKLGIITLALVLVIGLIVAAVLSFATIGPR